MSSTEPLAICVIGAGPRGLIAVERLCANSAVLASGSAVEIHVVEPYAPGAGKVWQSDQDRSLLMNTVSSDITVFTDDSVMCDGPVSSGPTQYEWARMVAKGEIPVDATTFDEAVHLDPWSYPSRAFQGRYLEWAFSWVLRNSAAEVTVHVHRTRARALEDTPDRRQQVWLLGQSEPLRVHAVVLAQGHFDVAAGDSERSLTAWADKHGLTYLPAASPAEVSLDSVQPGEQVLMRGLGLNFFDYIALLTAGRGGRFKRNRTDGRLEYIPSGREPVVHAGSGRGVPYLARAVVRGAARGKYAPAFLTPDVVAEFRKWAGSGNVDFFRDVWPLWAKEIGYVYYGHLLNDSAPGDREEFLQKYARHDWGSSDMEELIASRFPDAAARLDWDRLTRPARDRSFSGPTAYDEWVKQRLHWDVQESRKGPQGSAYKAVAAAMRSLRDQVRSLVSFRGISGDSYRNHIDAWFSGVNNFVASGPPASRIEELGALMEAGVVHMVGPRMRIVTDEAAGRFVASSPAVDGSQVAAETLIEAHLPQTDVNRSADPLIRYLMESGEGRAHVIPNTDGSGYRTGGLDVEQTTLRVITRDGRPHPARFSYGPPIESVQWVTAIGARPGVDSGILRQGDMIARSCLEFALECTARHPSADRAEPALAG
ncbi:FAD/NAD(P)-binding protein [Streptomyces olivaceiscleroticus]|uniref:FAD/NAD(P)-binding protein n=1 Tax=Streptomyces olivaceiscleroticus TaxID=68245 RepID=A0ABN1AMV0_9ACTN